MLWSGISFRSSLKSLQQGPKSVDRLTIPVNDLTFVRWSDPDHVPDVGDFGFRFLRLRVTKKTVAI